MLDNFLSNYENKFNITVVNLIIEIPKDFELSIKIDIRLGPLKIRILNNL